MQFFQWIATNWEKVCGWAGGLYLTYHVCRLIVTLILAINSVILRFTQAEKTLTLVATNHLPHLQKEMEKTNVLLEGIRDELHLVLKERIEENG